MPERLVSNVDRYALTRNGRRIEALRGERIMLTDAEAARFDALKAGTTPTGTEPVAAGSRTIEGLGADVLAPVSPGQAAHQEGRVYYSGSGRVALSVAGNVRGLLTNPAGSGVKVSVVNLSVFVSSASFTITRRNPDTGLPASAIRPRMRTLLVPAAAEGSLPVLRGELKVDTDATVALSGGTETGITIAAGSGMREVVDLANSPITLWPGEMFGFGASFAGAADLVVNLALVDTPL